MALTLIPEDGTGLANANSFASVDEADAYNESQLYGAAWTAAIPERKTAALVMATRLLDSACIWPGSRTYPAVQALAWPRSNVVVDGVAIPTNIVPTPVKNATCELARLLLSNDLTVDPAENNLKRINLGDSALEIEFRDGSKKQQIPTIISTLLAGFGSLPTSGGINLRPIQRA